MTPEETIAMLSTCELWDKIAAIQKWNTDDLQEIERSILTIQNIIISRKARREYNLRTDWIQ